jgi:hypothetical protein
MKIRTISSRRSLLSIALFLLGCRTDTSGPDSNSARDFRIGETQAQSCQVQRNLGQDGFLQNYRYDSRGFVSSWYDGVGTYLPQYDATGVLTTARYMLGDFTLASITYEYTAGKIVKEMWFNGATGLVDDKIVNTWNANGQLTRRESVPFGVFATFQYDALGNARQVDVLDGNGVLLLSNTYTFQAPVKSPDLTLRGLPYGLQFINYVFNPRRQTSAKAVVSDPEGNRVTLFDQDPQKSVLIAGQQQFPLYQNFFDTMSGTFYAQTWSYANCSGNNFPPDIPGTQLLAGSQRAGPSDFALRGSMKSAKQQIEALRRKFSP